MHIEFELKIKHILIAVIVLGLIGIFLFAKSNIYFETEEVVLPQKRGNIESADGNIWSCDTIRYLIAVDCLANNETLNLCQLGESLAISFPKRNPAEWLFYLRQEKRKGNRYIKIGRTTDKQMTDSLQKKFPVSLMAHKEAIRLYPSFPYASATLGVRTKFVYSRDFWEGNPDIEGLEEVYHDYLEGQPGVGNLRFLVVRVPFSNKIFLRKWIKTTKYPVHGKDVLITLNESMQKKSHEALKDILQEHMADYGTILISDIQGKIRVNANLCLNDSGEYSELYNLAISYRMVYAHSKKIPVFFVQSNENVNLRKYMWPMVSDTLDNFEIAPIDLLANINSTLAGTITRPSFVENNAMICQALNFAKSYWLNRWRYIYPENAPKKIRIASSLLNLSKEKYNKKAGNFLCITDTLRQDNKNMVLIAGISEKSKKCFIVSIATYRNNLKEIEKAVLSFIGKFEQ